MRILIEKKNLIDFPYDPKRKELNDLFLFDNDKVSNLVSEIMYASPTCYLVSGYRGAGKTSFIKKVQEKCEEAADKSFTNGARKILFVYSSFSRYENQTNFLRKIIRDLYEAVLKTRVEAGAEMKDLYKQTFLQVKRERSNSLEREHTLEGKAGISAVINFLKLCIPALPALLTNAVKYWQEQPLPDVVNIAGYVASAVWFALTLINYSFKIKRTDGEKYSESSLADEDITSYYLDRLFDKFIEQGYKLVFVLDELDKVDDEDLDKLLKELKPWLVRGKADFIVVAGQKLTLKYYQLKENDDEMLASLFSKIVHINLLPDFKFEKLFNDYLFKGLVEDDGKQRLLAFSQMRQEDSTKVLELRNSLVYKSKRLPRTFTNLLRQALKWDGEMPYLEVSDFDFVNEKKRMELLLPIFEQIGLNAEIPETIKDHLVMQLFQAAGQIDCKRKAVVDIANVLIAYKDYQYKNVKPVLENYVTQLFAAAAKEGLIALPATETESIVEKVTEMAEVLPANAEMGVMSDKANGISDGMSSSISAVEAIIGTKEKNTATEVVADKQLISFQRGFQQLIQYLVNMRSYFPSMEGVNRADMLSVATLINQYSDKGILDFSIPEPSVLSKPSDFYENRKEDSILLGEVQEVFKRLNVSIPAAVSLLFYRFSESIIAKVFLADGNYRIEDDIVPRDKSYVDFKLTPISTRDAVVDLPHSEPEILFNVKYLNSAVRIGAEEISKSTSFLADYNSVNEIGSYYLQIFFFESNEHVDHEKVALLANNQVGKVAPELQGKVTYIVLPASFFGNLENILTEHRKHIQPYNIMPLLQQEKPKKRERKVVMTKGIDPDDPNKGQFGAQNELSGRKLSATVIEDSGGWFSVSLTVESTNPDNPLNGKVTFYLHPTFRPDKITVIAKDNKAEVKDLMAYEAFTVGAACDNNTTRLELDMNQLKDVPKAFKYS